MRSLYKGIIGFGLVSIPIQLYKAMDEERVEVHWVHKACGNRIRYQKFCPVCESVVEASDLARGAPLADGRHVILPEEKAPLGEPDHSIRILSFHELGEIDPVFYQQAYWLKAGTGGQKAYALLAEVMEETGRVAVCEMNLRSRESLAVLRTYGEKSLMLHKMFYPEHLRHEGAHFGDLSVTVSDKEKSLARTLVEHMAESFVPEEFPNRERARLVEQIQALMPHAMAPEMPGRASQEVMDLMEQLKASVKAPGVGHGAG